MPDARRFETPLADLFPRNLFEAMEAFGLTPHLATFAAELASWPTELPKRERKDLFLVALLTLANQAMGHTRLRWPLEPDGWAVDLLERVGRADLIQDPSCFATTGLVGLPGDAKPLIWDAPWLSSQRMRERETRLAHRALALAQRPPLAQEPPESVLQEPVVLNAEQRQAVRLALEHPLALITGGPGTGKTAIVAAILRALLQQADLKAEEIALAAPTGKAAQRMGESIRKTLAASTPLDAPLVAVPEPQTLHRLLAWNPGEERFRHHADHPLPHRIVLVDEASMISLEHMERLFQSLPPEGRLVLLGDADQLPSVEAGRAFRDLVEGMPEACVRLRTSYRMRESDPQGRHILSVAQEIRSERWNDLWEGEAALHVRETPREVAFSHVEQLSPSRETMEAFLRLWFDQQVLALEGFPELAAHVYQPQAEGWSPEDADRLKRLFDHFDRFRILAALRDAPGLRGVASINARMHGWMAEHTGEGLRHGVPFHVGEPILMTTNDARRRIFNGDQGLVLKVRFEDGVRQAAVFPRLDGARAFPLDALKTQVELCYAMTVHKSQGSEYDCVALVLPSADHRLLTRELLYTALTRARKSVILLGEAERLRFTMGHPTQRESGLGDALARMSQGPAEENPMLP
ncbi:MAG: exodeoxyribonuclease V subunit alpha [Firmicutes bacterium]|nr:exodeoxyribonuclease V subunit alpha [Bacillota bacterium]